MSETELVVRLEKLERDNRRLRGLALVVALLAGGLGCIFATRSVPQTIIAHAFEVVDGAGHPRVKLSCDSVGNSAIRLYDAHGLQRALIAVSPTGLSVIDLFDSGDLPVVELSTDFLGFGPAIKVAGSHWTGFTLIRQGDAEFYGAGLTSTESVGVRKDDMPFVVLRGPHGFEMDLGSAATEDRATGETQRSSAASIVMFGNDKDHRVIWQAP